MFEASLYDLSNDLSLTDTDIAPICWTMQVLDESSTTNKRLIMHDSHPVSTSPFRPSQGVKRSTRTRRSPTGR